MPADGPSTSGAVPIAKPVFNATTLRACAWMGPVFIVLFLVGAVPVSQLIPPSSPADSLQETMSLYADNLTGTRLGCVLMAISVGAFLPWGISIAYATRPSQTGFPIMFWIQIASAAICTLIILLIAMFWGLAAFRAGVVSPEITQTWHDAGWFALLFAWPPFSLWPVVIAIPILADRSGTPRIPRWIGYFNIWVAVSFIPAGLIIFFKTGPFAWDGIIAFWIPIVMIFAWVVLNTVMVLKAITKDEQELAAVPSPVLDDAPRSLV